MTRRWRPPDARALRLVCGIVLLLAACGPLPSAPPVPTEPGLTAAPSGTVSPPSIGPPPEGGSVRIYLVLGFGQQAGLVPVLRAVDAGAADPEGAVAALLGGPTDVEQAARPAVYTAIPDAVELLGLTIDGRVATVDLTGAFEAATDDGLPTSMRLAQVVYTVTSFPEIDSVRFAVDGALVTVIGPDGLVFSIDGPADRDDLLKALPPLFIDDPTWGATISSPVRIAGLANAFEATFQVRLADAEGRGLAAGPVTATCGTGCWGTFEASVPFSVPAPGPGVLQAFELSPRDGAMDNLREYPVWLTP